MVVDVAAPMLEVTLDATFVDLQNITMIQGDPAAQVLSIDSLYGYLSTGS